MSDIKGTREFTIYKNSNDSIELKKGVNRVGVNRFFLGPFNAKVFGEEIKEKQDKIFDDILQEEHAKFIQLVSKMEKKWNTENVSRKNNLKAKYYLSSNE